LGRDIEVFQVVDGQQRLVTLELLVLALFEVLRDESLGKGLWVDFVERDGVGRLELGGANTVFFRDLIKCVGDRQALPESPRVTNHRIRASLNFFREKLGAVSQLPGGLVPIFETNG
jgi:hypothetical protein